MICYTFPERLKFAVYQMHITSSKNINEEEHKQFKNEEFEDW